MAASTQVRTAKRKAKCPACGGPVEFRLGTSLVTVCEFCRSVVARGDRQLEDHGKLADLHETESPLKLGLTGKWDGKTLRLVGRAQYRHFAGGVWDEWYVGLANGKWGWLAEAQGKFYLTFYKALAEKASLPAVESLTAGQTVDLGKLGLFTVNEVGLAAFEAAEGELPFDPQKGGSYRFADLSGPNGAFATFDYSHDVPLAYIGREVSLDELQIQGLEREIVATPVSGLQLNCPRCGGPFTLHAPETAERTTCPNCRALLDINGTKLEFLETLQPPKPALVLPLGAKGTLKGTEFTIIGYLRRSVTYDKKYYWAEYLLYHPREGFRWLVHSDDHWSFVKSLSPADVKLSGKKATWNGQTFSLFQSAIVTVQQVYGEFYWKVKKGEDVHGMDYVAPPYMISVERTDPRLGEREGQEINFSLGEYLPHAELERAFGVKNLRRGWGVAPNQPCPLSRVFYGYWVIYLLAIIGIWLIGTAFRAEGVDSALFVWALILVSVMPIAGWLYRSGYEGSRWKESEFTAYGEQKDAS